MDGYTDVFPGGVPANYGGPPINDLGTASRLYVYTRGRDIRKMDRAELVDTLGKIDTDVLAASERLEGARSERAALARKIDHESITVSRVTRLRDYVLGRIAALDRPVEPELSTSESHAVISFTKRAPVGDRMLTYAAVGYHRDGRTRWTLTGVETRPRTWAELLTFAGEEAWESFTELSPNE